MANHPAAKLYQLQVLDLELDEKSGHLQQAERALGETPAVLSERERLRVAIEDVAHVETRIRQLESELDKQSAKVAELQKHLFGGGVGKQKEASALERELQALKETRGRTEDALLEAMAEAEAMPGKLATVRAEVTRAEATWRDEQAAQQGEVDQLREDINRLEAIRVQLVQDLAPGTLAIYDDLRRTRRRRAVARIERNTCQGCRIALPMGEVQRARTSSELSLCSFCGRILYVDR